MCWDSTSIDDVEKLMDWEKADMVFTDPPYNLWFNYNSYKDDKTYKEYNEFCYKWVCNLFLKSNKVIITPWKQNISMWANMQDTIWEITDIWIWIAKNKMSWWKISNLSLWEPILFYWEFNRNSRPTDLFEFNVAKQKWTWWHTCPKILSLIEEFISSYSILKWKILDVFWWSWTTLIASEKTNRKCYMMEIDEKYITVILQRYYKYTDWKKEIKCLNRDIPNFNSIFE